MSGNNDLQARLGSIEQLLQKIESAADPVLRAMVRELTETVMSLHGAGLERIVASLRADGESALLRLTGDDLVSSLLILHGLHPLTIHERIHEALEKLRSNGASLQLLSLEDGAVRIRIAGRVRKQTVEDAVYQAAPDLASLMIEDADDKQGFVPLEMLVRNQRVPVGEGGL